jgi:hypothetical protein
MAESPFYSLRNFGLNILAGFGKDQYTQTSFSNVSQFASMMKGEEWLDVRDGQKFLLYNTVPQLKAVIDRRASMKATGRWQHCRTLADGTKEIVENSPFVLLHENPNFLQNGQEFDMLRSMQFDIYGNAVNFVRTVGKTPKMLWNLDPEFVSMDRTGKMFRQVDISGVISKYRFEQNGLVSEEFDPKEIIHFRQPNPKDQLKGLSRIEALKLVISNIRAAYGFRNRIITSDAMLGILASDIGGAGNSMNPELLDTKEQERLNQGFRAKWGMQEGKGDIMQTEKTVKWIPMSYPTKDLMLFEEVDSDFEALIDAYGLNRNIFSFSKQSTFENMEHGVKLCYRDTIIPECDAESIGYTKFYQTYCGMPENEYMEKCFDHLDVLKNDDSASKSALAQAAATLIAAGVGQPQILEITGVDVGVVKPIVQPVGGQGL